MEFINQIICGDCLEIMPLLPDKSVDMILCDLPYGTTACKWDTVIDPKLLWDEYKRLIKPRGAIALFGSEPFSSLMRNHNIEMFKYDWIWEKGRASGFVHAKNKPLKSHEIISIYSEGTTGHSSKSAKRMIYNPQMETGKPYKKKITKVNTGELNSKASRANTNYVGTININQGFRYPRSVIRFSMHNVGNYHPTQKPVELSEYLIKTYTNEGDIVLDNCIGSGTTAVACINTNRQFIGIEKDEGYCDIARKRVNDALER